MRIWFAESALKKDFVAYLSDTYDGKPILVAETRNITNAFIRNFTIARDPHSEKFSKEVRVVEAATKAALAELPEDIVILDDWFDKTQLKDIDYYILHKPEDSDPLFRMSKVDTDVAKSQARVIDAWNTLRLKVPERVLVLGYDERARDVFEIDDTRAEGITLRMLPGFAQAHKYKGAERPQFRLEAAQALGGVSEKEKKNDE